MKPLSAETFPTGQRHPQLVGDDQKAVAPRGEVTLVFTDVQGSTSLWEQNAEVMSKALQLHFRRLRTLTARFGGYEVKTEGDAFMVAFSSTVAAVDWACAVQESLLDEEWPEELLLSPEAGVYRIGSDVLFRGLRLRIGIHRGTAEVVEDARTGAVDYFGRTVNIAARVTEQAVGGQVLVTQDVWRELLLDNGDHGWISEQLGERSLKGIEKPLPVVQVTPISLVARNRHFQPVRQGTAGLWRQTLSFVGRTQELHHLSELFRKGARLVTILGPGGVGKTRLATEYAYSQALCSKHEHRSRFCDLTEARDLAALCNSVAESLGIPLPPTNSEGELVERIGHALASHGNLLLILDNFEQITACAPAVQTWLEMTEATSFIVTTRELLHLPQEKALPLLPLYADDAVTLFTDRARLQKPELALTPEDKRAVEEIVVRLDGVPLAIELAAARMNLLSARAIRDRLAARFDLLVSRNKDVSRRRLSLDGAIEWSWELLSEAEREALIDCSVFAGGFDVIAAEAVVIVPEGDPLAVLEMLSSLKDKSMLRCDGGSKHEDERLGMYEAIRDFVARKAVGTPQRLAAMQRHRHHFAERARELLPQLRTAESEALYALARESDNMVAALHRTRGTVLEGQDAVDVLDIALALVELLLLRGPSSTALELIELVLESGKAGPADRIAKARFALARVKGFHAESNEELERALFLAKQSGLASLAAFIHVDLAIAYRNSGKLREAQQHIDEATRCAPSSDLWLKAYVVGNSALVDLESGKADSAESKIREALQLFRTAGDKRYQVSFNINLGILFMLRDQLTEATTYLERAKDLGAAHGYAEYESDALWNLGCLHWAAGKPHAARAHFQAAVMKREELGDRSQSFYALMLTLASCTAACGDAATARTLFERADETTGQSDLILTELRNLLLAHLDLANARLAAAAQRRQEVISHWTKAKDRLNRLNTSALDNFVSLRINKPVIAAAIEAQMPEELREKPDAS